MNQTEETDVAALLRGVLVEQLRSHGVIRTDQVERAFRAVPRHLFTPDATVEKAYAPDDAVVTKRDADGQAVSSVSAPTVVAMMLEQAAVESGDRVLEVGSGGYNAALLAELAGPDGSVTTMDIDPDVIDRAGRCLSAAGYDRVRVMRGDGEFGMPDEPRFDVILVTVGAWDIPPAWWEQLADGGRLVVPMRMRGITRSIALVREGERLVSTSVLECGFVPMQGVGAVVERLYPIHGVEVMLRVDGRLDLDRQALAAALAGPRAEAWSEVTVGPHEPFSDLDLWLTATMPGFCLLTAAQQAIDAGVVDPTWRLATPTATRGGSLAYRSKPRPVDDARTRFEFGAYGHGPSGDALAQHLVEQIRAWDRRHRAGPGASIAVYPADTRDERLPDGHALVIDKRHTRVVLSWP